MNIVVEECGLRNLDSIVWDLIGWQSYTVMARGGVVSFLILNEKCIVDWYLSCSKAS